MNKEERITSPVESFRLPRPRCKPRLSRAMASMGSVGNLVLRDPVRLITKGLSICAGLFMALTVPGNCLSAEGQATGSVTNGLPNVVTLEEIVAEILAHNPELNFYKAEIAAAK